MTAKSCWEGLQYAQSSYPDIKDKLAEDYIEMYGKQKYSEGYRNGMRAMRDKIQDHITKQVWLMKFN